MIDAVPSLGQPLAIMVLAAPGGRGPLPHLLCIVAGDLGDGLECLVHGLEGVTELAEGVVVVIDRGIARAGGFCPVGGFSFWRAPSWGSFSAQPQIAGEAPLGR